MELEKSWKMVCRGRSLTDRREAWMLFEQKILAETRISEPCTSDELRRPRGRVVTVAQLTQWLSLRNKQPT
jgi:hypothetical protein